ncbi:hypothetical protein [Nocardia beijingensis]
MLAVMVRGGVVDAESVSDDRCGCLQDQLPQGRYPAGDGGDSVLGGLLAERFGSERLADAAAWEQPKKRVETGRRGRPVNVSISGFGFRAAERVHRAIGFVHCVLDSSAAQDRDRNGAPTRAGVTATESGDDSRRCPDDVDRDPRLVGHGWVIDLGAGGLAVWWRCRPFL